MNEIEILKRMCYRQTEYGWYKCVANIVITYQYGIFKCLFKSMSENTIHCWKIIDSKITAIQDLQRLEGDLLRCTSFGSPWSDQLVPELPMNEQIQIQLENDNKRNLEQNLYS